MSTMDTLASMFQSVRNKLEPNKFEEKPETADATVASLQAEADKGAPVKPDILMKTKLKEMEGSDVFKNADKAKKLDIYKKFYNTYVVPNNNATKNNLSLYDFTRGHMLKMAGQGGIPISDPAVTSGTEKFLGGAAHGLETLVEAPYRGVQKLDQTYEDFKKGAQLTSALAGGRVMGPVAPEQLTPEKQKVKSDILENYSVRDKRWMDTHYDNSFHDLVLKEGGTMAGQLPAFEVTGSFLKSIGLDALMNPELLGKASMLTRMGSRMLYNAANGYLVGAMTMDDPTQTAMGFAAMSEVFRPIEKYVGKILGLGGDALMSQMVKLGKDSAGKDIAATVSPVTVALAGSNKQKITASTVNMLNEVAGGNFASLDNKAKMEVINKVAKMSPELSNELGAVNKSIVNAKATISINRQRSQVPEFNDIMNKLESFDKTPSGQTVSDSVAKKAENRKIVKQPGQIKVGAASADSIEFEDNYSKAVDGTLNKLGLGKDKIQWEDRGHKLLFYLNILMTDNKALGPSKERNKMFNMLLRHLNDRYPNQALPELVKMSDNVWTKLENLTKAGIMNEEGPVRFFRQSELRPGQSPFGHEVQLLHEAQRLDKVKDAYEATQVLEKPLSTYPHERYDPKVGVEPKGQKKPEKPPIPREKRARERSPEEIKRNAIFAQARKELGDSKTNLADITNEQLDMKVKEIEARMQQQAGTLEGAKKDTNYTQVALDKLFPGKTIGDLKPTELSQVLQEANILKNPNAPTMTNKADEFIMKEAKRKAGTNAKPSYIIKLFKELKANPASGGDAFAFELKKYTGE